MAIYNFGSINIDHVYKVPHLVMPGETISSSDYQSVLGGKGANQSIALAQAGMSTYHVGAINQVDKQYVGLMQNFGVDCTHVSQLEDVASGHAIIQVDEQAENAIFLFGGANQSFTPTLIQAALSGACDTDTLLIQNETNALSDIIDVAKAKGMQLVFNPAPMTEQVKHLPLDKIDLFIVNEIEAQQLTNKASLDEVKDALLSSFPESTFVITLGKKGACYLSKETQVTVDAFSVDAVDTTAAGDTFIGFYLAGLADDKSIADALKYACAASALAVTKAGASTSIPTREDVSNFLIKQGPL